MDGRGWQPYLGVNHFRNLGCSSKLSFYVVRKVVSVCGTPKKNPLEKEMWTGGSNTDP